MAKLPAWNIRVLIKGQVGYDVTLETTVPGHKLTDASAKSLATALYLNARNATPDDIVDTYLVRNKRKSSNAIASTGQRFLDLELKQQGHSCGCSECIVSVSQEMSEEMISFWKTERARVA